MKQAVSNWCFLDIPLTSLNCHKRNISNQLGESIFPLSLNSKALDIIRHIADLVPFPQHSSQSCILKYVVKF